MHGSRLVFRVTLRRASVHPCDHGFKIGIGEAVFEMPAAFTVPATGTLDYAYIVLPTRFTKDTWVTAAEIRPGARSVVHHMSAIVRPAGSPWLKDAHPGIPYFPPGGASPRPICKPG
jgi:hypothetical protein